MRVVRNNLVLGALVGALGSCAADEPASAPSMMPAVVLDRTTIDLDAIGARAQLRATALDARGVPVPGATFIWSSRDSTVAVVTDSGVVIARANGATAVLARHETERGSAEVVVRQVGVTLFKVSGDQQAGAVGRPLPARLVARVTDRFGHPVEGTTVFFRVQGGGGSLSDAAPATDEDGLASTAWTLGPAPGDQTAAASLTPGALTPAIYNATAR